MLPDGGVALGVIRIAGVGVGFHSILRSPGSGLLSRRYAGAAGASGWCRVKPDSSTARVTVGRRQEKDYLGCLRLQVQERSISGLASCLGPRPAAIVALHFLGGWGIVAGTAVATDCFT